MSFMFEKCFSLKELNLSNFNTRNVISIRGMFSNCKSLEKLNLSNFNNNRETIMDDLFEKCTSLKELICSNEFIREKYDNRNNKNSQNLYLY